ncbi:type IV pilus modification PilV family protein [Oscillibacter sp.]|uniref:type IV pilus modification PilV family protein n=1 Tax=Oscillibacter sp. TaxID=1945593 RepID=UPI002D801B68|nr:hypothetical protein [Oscillibacter sp.]
MREKLRSTQGETLVEVLASVLVCALSVMLLLGAVSASASIDLQAQAADSEYYEALSRAERQSKTEVPSSDPGVPPRADVYDAPSGTKLRVENSEGAFVEIPPGPSDKLYFYGGKQLLSYAIDPPPDESDETGGGG